MPDDDRKPWEKTIEEYLDGKDVGGATRREMSPEEVASYLDHKAYKNVSRSPLAPDYAFHYDHHQHFRIVHEPTQQTVGGFAGSLVYVLPEHRGKNLTSVFYMMCEDKGINMENVRMLTPASLGAFRKTHALMVERAMRAGEPVPFRVLSQYRPDASGRLGLRKPYLAEDVRARYDLMGVNAHVERILDATRTQDVSFVPDRQTDDIAGGEVITTYPLRIRMCNTPGLRLAEAAAQAGGGKIRVITTYYEDGPTSYDPAVIRKYQPPVFGALIGDKIVDGLGSGPAETWGDKLAGVGALSDEVIFPFFATKPTTREIRDFDNVSDCVAWMRAEGVGFGKHGFGRAKTVRDTEAEARAADLACAEARRIRNDLDVAAPSR